MSENEAPDAEDVATFCGQFDAFVDPVESFITNPARDFQLLPIHLEAIQEGFDLIAPMAYLLPTRIYDAAAASLRMLRAQLEELHNREDVVPLVQKWEQNDKGIWSLDIDQDILIELTELRIPDVRIGEMLGCCRHTILRRRVALGLSKQHQNVDMNELCQAIEAVRKSTE
ncbi:unnamed protein product [Tilletia controversa]|nr:unnamed protein product [Tilletia controversa]